MKNSYKSKKRFKKNERSTSRFTVFSSNQTKNHCQSSFDSSQQNVDIMQFSNRTQISIETKISQSNQTQISNETVLNATKQTVQTKKTVFKNEFFQIQRKTRNKKNYKNQIKIIKFDDENKNVELSLKRSNSIQSAQSTSNATNFSNSNFFVNAVNMMKLINNTNEIEFLFENELIEKFIINSNQFSTLYRIENFKRSDEFSKHITFQKKNFSISTISKNMNVIDLILRLKQKSESKYTIIQILIADFDSYKKKIFSQLFHHEKFAKSS